MNRIEGTQLSQKLGLILLALMLFALPARPQTLSALHIFSGPPDGLIPNGGQIRDLEGNLYGTTAAGGPTHFGTLYKISVNGTYTLLHSFTLADGVGPEAGVVFGGNGILYGTASDIGQKPPHFGTIFAFDLNTNMLTVLYRFHGNSDGAHPITGVILAGQTGLIGTVGGGSTGGEGLIYELNPQNGVGNPWVLTPLHTFTGGYDGAVPDGNTPLQDSQGTIWGTTPFGGVGYGVLYKIEISGGFVNFLTAYAFSNGATGSGPVGNLVEDKNGILYGTTAGGGVHNAGIVFSYDTRGGATPSPIYTFSGTSDGGFPSSGLAIDPSGNLYGTTEGGGTAEGASGKGVAFELRKPQTGSKWTYNSLHIFSGLEDGAFPSPGPILLSGGVLYGATLYGGLNTPNDGEGLAYRINSKAIGVTSLSFSPTSAVGGTSLAGTVNLTGISGAPGQRVLLSSNETFAKVPASLHIDSGTTKGTFTLTSSAVAKNSVATITASLNGLAKTFNVTILAPTLTSLSLNPVSVVGGAKTTGTVKLNGVAPTGGLVVALSSNSKAATVPTKITIPAGSTSATFTVITSAVKANTTATISCVLNGVTLNQTLTIES
jgi:uncharacterized repeat protein (TIGR03803 family)